MVSPCKYFNNLTVIKLEPNVRRTTTLTYLRFAINFTLRKSILCSFKLNLNYVEIYDIK